MLREQSARRKENNMSSSIAQIESQLRRIENLVPPGEPVKDYLRGVLDNQIASMSEETSMGIVPTSMYSANKAYASARFAVESLDEPEELAQQGTEGIVNLGVIEWALRPALPLPDNLFEPPAAGPWHGLEADLVEGPARSVCRLDLSIKGYQPSHVGSGFVVGEDDKDRLVIMTNTHVVREARNAGWMAWPEVGFACDFKRYATGAGGPLLLLDEAYDLHESYDLALVYLPKENLKESAPTPAPLTVVSELAGQALDLQVGVVGHPSFHPSQDLLPKYFGFGNEFGIKRFSPGLIRHLGQKDWSVPVPGNSVYALLHDASTLKGSSGSCILDLNTLQVVGLHFGGWPLAPQSVTLGEEVVLAELFSENGAVPLWTLHDDPLLSNVNFA
jgi:hypothetical protein